MNIFQKIQQKNISNNTIIGTKPMIISCIIMLALSASTNTQTQKPKIIQVVIKPLEQGGSSGRSSTVIKNKNDLSQLQEYFNSNNYKRDDNRDEQKIDSNVMKLANTINNIVVNNTGIDNRQIVNIITDAVNKALDSGKANINQNTKSKIKQGSRIGTTGSLKKNIIGNNRIPKTSNAPSENQNVEEYVQEEDDEVDDGSDVNFGSNNDNGDKQKQNKDQGETQEGEEQAAVDDTEQNNQNDQSGQDNQNQQSEQTEQSNQSSQQNQEQQSGQENNQNQSQQQNKIQQNQDSNTEQTQPIKQKNNQNLGNNNKPISKIFDSSATDNKKKKNNIQAEDQSVDLERQDVDDEQ